MGATTKELSGSPDTTLKRMTTAQDRNDGSSRHYDEQQQQSTEQNQIQQHWFEALTSPTQFMVLSSGVFLFFGIHNYLQEAIMSIPDFKFGVMLGCLEVCGVTFCSFLERKFVARETHRVAPLSAYPLLTFCLLSSSSLSNLALNYINFPTKVVFRSCKVSDYKNVICMLTLIGSFGTVQAGIDFQRTL